MNGSFWNRDKPQASSSPPLFYEKLLLSVRPPIASVESDESDIEMEEELSASQDNLIAGQRQKSAVDFNEFVFEEDEDIDAPTTENIITNTVEINETLDTLIEFDTIPESMITEPVQQMNIAPSRDSIEDFMTFEPIENTIDYVSLLDNDPQELGKQLVGLNNLDLSTTLYHLILKRSEKAPEFLLRLIHDSSTNGTRIAATIPPLIDSPLNHFLESRKIFAQNYPQFEGNFSLADFTKENRNSPPPVGNPPVCVDAVKQLQSMIDFCLSAFRASPSQLLAEEAYVMYQCSSYLIAKLKQFNVKTTYLETLLIPLNKNNHTNIKNAFEKAQMNISFPATPFDYNNEMILKRLRPPAQRNLYQ